jgi:hypothetical protein
LARNPVTQGYCSFVMAVERIVDRTPVNSWALWA